MAFTKAGLWGPEAIIDSSGHPQPGATATLYLPDEVTLASLWTTSAKSVALANPTQADIHANLHFWTDPGQYRLRVNVGTVVTWLDVEVPIDPGEAAQDQDVVAAQAAAEAYADGIVTAGLATKQPLDSDLTAIAALATTTFGRGLLILADATAGRAAFGSVIGTDVQAHDSDLDAIAALATTAFGRALLVLADAAALRTAAGLGTAATHATGDFDAAGTAAAAVAALVAGAPGALDTLNELATALADDASFATTVTNALAAKSPILNPTAVKTGNYTAAATDYVLCDTSGGIFTVTLPTAPADKTSIAVDLVASGNTLTIARGGADVFQKAGGPTSLTMNTANRVLVLQYQSSTAVWHVQDHLPAVVTTKGDLLTYGTERARLAVGADGALLGADSTQTTGLKWIPSGTYVPGGVILSGADTAGVTDTGAVINAAIVSARGKAGPLVVPGGTFQIGTSLIPPVSDVVVRGQGYGAGTGAATTLRRATDVPILAAPTTTSTRFELRDIGLTDTTNAGRTTPLIDATSWFINSLEDVYLYNSNWGIWFHSDGASTTSDLVMRNCVLQRLDTMLLIDGAYSFHAISCDFERAVSGAAALITIKGLSESTAAHARSFQAADFTDCHFEVITFMASGAHGVSVKGGFMEAVAVVLDEASSYCTIAPAAFVNSSVVDLGFNNRVEGVLTNSREQGVRPWTVSTNMVTDSGFRAPAATELVFFAHAWPVGAALTNVKFTYADLTPTTLYETNTFSLAMDMADANINTHIPKATMSNIMCLAVGASGGITVTGAPVEVKAKKNLVTNGTFGSGTASETGWSKNGVPTSAASGTAGYTTLTIGAGTGYFQAMPTIPGHRYMLLAQTLDTNAQFCVGSAWDGSGTTATAQPAALRNDPNNAFMRQIVWEATSTSARISVGSTGATTTTVRFIAVVDLDDAKLYANRAPQAGTWQAGDFVQNLSFAAGGIIGWRCTAAGTPGTWSTVYDQSSSSLDIGFAATSDPRISWGNATFVAANAAAYSRVTFGALASCGHILFNVGVQSGNIDVGVYDTTGSGRTAAPTNRKTSSGSTPCPASGQASVALGASVAVNMGDWLALAADNTTMTVGRTTIAAGGLASGISYAVGTSFPLPNPGGSGVNSFCIILEGVA